MARDKVSHKLAAQIRKWAGIAYERELAVATKSLMAEFQRWEGGEIDVFALNDKIHEFHHGISRTLYNRHTSRDGTLGVACGLRSGVLKREEVGDEVFLQVEGILPACPDIAAA